jgi:hypothetical protein
MPRSLPRYGRLVLEDGELVGRTDDGRETGRFYIGPNGVTFEGELSMVQLKDPPALRMMAIQPDGNTKYAGRICFNRDRPDGSMDEIAFVAGGIAEDSQPGERRGQVTVSITRDNLEEPSVAQVWTSAYSFQEFGRRVIWSGIRRALTLWKFETPEPPVGTPPDPLPQPPSPPPGPTPPDPVVTERFLQAIEAEFGFPIDPGQRASALQGRTPLREVHDDMMARNNGEHRPELHPATAPY